MRAASGMSGEKLPVLLLAGASADDGTAGLTAFGVGLAMAPAASRLPALLGLDRHLRLCQLRSMSLYRLRCRADAMRGLFAGRPITVLALVLMAVGLATALT